VALEVAKRLSDPRPYDLERIDLNEYKGLARAWRSWSKVEAICRRLGGLLGNRLTLGGAQP